MLFNETQNKHKRTAGFSIIELMVSLAILGVLATIAISAYNDYLVRARVSEVLQLSSTLKAAITEYRLTQGVMPTSYTQVGGSTPSTQYVNSISVGTAGVITITGNQTTLGTGGPLSITLTPTFSNGAVLWTCQSSGQTQYAPGSCK